jgi:hypothetical protein
MKTCDVPTYAHVFIQFRTSGYPRKLRREWDAADANETLAIVLRYVESWNMTGVGGENVPHGTDVACLDNVEDAVVSWLIRTFMQFWLFELPAPRPNS